MKNRIRKTYRAIKSKLSKRMIWFFVLCNLTAFTAWKVYSFFSFENTVEQTSSAKISKEHSLKELAAILKLETDDNLFTVGLPPINNALYVNTKNKTLLFQSDKQIAIEYESTSSLIKKVKAGSEKAFDDFINTNFKIANYTQLLSEASNIETSEVIAVGTLIGADSDYLQQVAAISGIDIRTILLSLIYNTVYSGSSGQIATIVENKKLKNITDKNYKIDKVNTALLAESLTKLKSDAGNDRTKFIESEYNKLHPTNESIDTGESENTLQVSIQKLLRTKAIRLDASVPFDFAYINFRKDIFYCGEKAYPYYSDKLYVKDNSSLDFLFSKQFSLPNYNSLTAAEIVSRIGIPLASIESSEANTNSQTAFKAILNYLLNHPSVYCIYSGKLQSPFSIKNDSIQYGKFDAALLQSGFDNLSQGDSNDSEYSIVRKENTTPRIIYAALLLLFISYSVGLFIHSKKEVVSIDDATPLTGDFEEQLRVEKEKFEKQIERNRKESLEKIIQFLTNQGDGFEYEKTQLLQIRHKSNFYDIIKKTKNLNEFIKVLEKEGEENFYIKRIPSANDVFLQANQEKKDSDKIIFLLRKFDESFSQTQKDNKNLADKYQELRKIQESSSKLNFLIAGKFEGNFHEYVKEQIEKIENNPSIKKFVQFGLLFKVSNQSKFTTVSENLLKVQDESDIFLEEFYSQYQKLDSFKLSPLFERTALLCLSLELSRKLLLIRQTPIEIELEKVKQDQLQLISARYFTHNAKNPEKSEDDFEFNIMEGKEKIAEYNSKIADETFKLKADIDYKEHINTLKELMRKIKYHDKTEIVFKKLHQNFVKEFTDKIDSLKFTREGLNDDDRSWLFRQLFNITFHAADYTEHFIRQDRPLNHPNFLFLMNDLDITKTEHRDFIANDQEKSNDRSNAIALAARYVGVKKLDILVGDFYIKAEDLIK